MPPAIPFISSWIQEAAATGHARGGSTGDSPRFPHVSDVQPSPIPPLSRSPNPRAKALPLAPRLSSQRNRLLPFVSSLLCRYKQPSPPPPPPRGPPALLHAADTPAPHAFAQWPPRPADLAFLIGPRSTLSYQCCRLVLTCVCAGGPPAVAFVRLLLPTPTSGSQPPLTCSTLQPASTMDGIDNCIDQMILLN